MDIIKHKVCAYYKIDPFKEDKPFEHWLQMYLTMVMVETENLLYIKKPLAELTGEITGGLINPDGLKEYFKEKNKRKDYGTKGVFSQGSSGGMAISNTTLRNGKIVDINTGQEVLSLEQLNKFLQKQSNL
jgi:hypothetical protein